MKAAYDVAHFNFETTTAELQKLIEIRHSAITIETSDQTTEIVKIDSVIKIQNQDTNQTRFVQITDDTIK